MASWKVWQEVPAAIGAGFSEVLRRIDHLALKLAVQIVEVPTPFVGVIVFGEGRSPVAATSGYLREYRETFEVDAMQEIRNGVVIVFADWQQVSIEGIFRGTDVLSHPSPCMGCFDLCTPGTKIRVLCRRREPVK